MAKKNKYYEDPDRSDVSNDRTSGLGEYTANYQTAMNMADENLASAQAKSQAIANTAQEQKTKAESYARAVGDNPTLGFTGDSQFYEGGYGYKPADQAAKQFQQTAEEKNSSEDGNSYADVFGGGSQQTAKSNWDNLRDQSATDLLNANIQTEMAKAAARRSLQNTMAAQGLDNSGYYGTGMAQLESNAMAQRQRNLSTYQQAIREQAEQTKAASLENLTNAIQRASSKEQIDRWLNAYGIEMVDGEPRGELYDGLSNETKSYIKSILRDSYENVYETSNRGYSSADELLQSGIKTEAGNNLDANYGVKDEINFLFNSSEGKNLAKEGQVVKLLSSTDQGTRNKKGDYVYLQFVNGKWRVASKSQFVAQPKDKQAVIHGEARSKATFVDYNNYQD